MSNPLSQTVIVEDHPKGLMRKKQRTESYIVVEYFQLIENGQKKNMKRTFGKPMLSYALAQECKAKVLEQLRLKYLKDKKLDTPGVLDYKPNLRIEIQYTYQ